MEEEKDKITDKITIEFVSPGSADFTINYVGNVTTNQLLVAASFLEFQAKYIMNRQLSDRDMQEFQKRQELEERNKILIPKGH